MKVRAVVQVSWMRGADIIACTVYGWCLIALSLLPNTIGLRAMLVASRNYEHGSKIPEFAVSVIMFSTAICAICLGCVRAIWPSAFIGERHSPIFKIVANEWRMLVGTRRHAVSFIINSVIYLAYDLCVVRITVCLRILLVVTHAVTSTETNPV